MKSNNSVTFEFNLRAISVNKLYVNIPGQSRRFKSTEGKNFTKAVEASLAEQLTPEQRAILDSWTTAKLSVEMVFIQPDWLTKKGMARRCDVENLSKGTSDSIISGLEAVDILLDDSQYFEVTVKKAYGESPKIIYTISEIPEWSTEKS